MRALLPARHRRVPSLLTLPLVALLLPTGDSLVGPPPLRRHFESLAERTAGVAASRPAVGSSRDGVRRAAPPVIGDVAGVTLHTPPGATHVGFHQSSSAAALGIAAGDGHDVLPSRARGTHPGSAVDIAMPGGVPVTSTVSGTVTVAEPYALYGTTPDEMVVVVTDARPDIEVRHLHLEGVTVHVGQHVQAGDVIAHTARQLPFPSQIDRLAGHGPHVHVEVHTAG